MDGKRNWRRMSSISATPIASWNGQYQALPAACGTGTEVHAGQD